MGWLQNIRREILRFLLKLMWTIGGHHDSVDGLPRIRGGALQSLLPKLAPGDLLLLGNNGLLSHIGVYIGEGKMIHSMATEKTMRGWLGSTRDAIARMLGASERFTGVIEETLDHFFERFERDTWVVLRHPELSPEAAARGIEHLHALVGKPYDYDFMPGDDSYYCTEIADAFLRAALGEAAPVLPTTHHRVPLLLDRDVLEPAKVLELTELQPVAANEAARQRYAEHLRSLPGPAPSPRLPAEATAEQR
ncbi:MAG TPA: hypothetical protein ENK18_20980 [Deltaproteobacteria bacterium]|nr:hypothetical protein [Deltaproteobacteria bacterium]